MESQAEGFKPSPSDTSHLSSLVQPVPQGGQENQQILSAIKRTFPSFESTQRFFIQQFAFAHLATLYPHAEFGLLQEDAQNILEHNILSGIYAAICSDELGLTKQERKVPTIASLLHDFSKLDEITKTDPLIEENTFTLSHFQKIKSEDQDRLRGYGFPEEVIAAAGANALENLHGPQNDAGKIVWLVDAMLYDTTPTEIKTRLEKGRTIAQENGNGQRGRRNQIMSDIMKEKLGGVDYYDAQEAVGERITTEFAARIFENKMSSGATMEECEEAFNTALNPQTLPTYLQRQFERRAKRFADSIDYLP